MDKIQLNQYIKSIADQIPVVNSFYTDDVYEVWNGGEIRFGSLCFCITSSSISDNTTVWSGLLYYGDRLLEDKSNRDAVQSDSINVINAIMNAIAVDEDIVSINYPTQVELFEQQFADYLAGGYATIQIETENSVSKCGYGYIKEVSGCESAIKELEDKVKDLQSDNKFLEDEVAELSEEVNNKNEEIDGLNNTIVENNNTITNLNNQVTHLETEVDVLEDQVENLTERLENNINPDFTSIGYDMENAGHFFNAEKEALAYAKKIQDEWDPTNGGSVSSDGMFAADYNLVYFPYVDTSKLTRMHSMFHNCKRLTCIPELDTRNATIMSDMFSECKLLRHTPLLHTGNATDMSWMFYNCGSIEQISLSDTSKVTKTRSMFSGCGMLESISPINTENVTDMYQMFYNCGRLSAIPQLNTSNIKDFANLFYGCSSLTTIPQLDTGNATTMSGMVQYCKKLISVPQMDTSKVVSVSSLFNGCESLESIPLLDFSSVTNISSFFGYSDIKTLTDLGGFTGLKINWASYGSLKNCPNLTVQSLLNVFNTIADVNGLGARTLEIGTTNLNKLTDEQKKIATDKGWTLK